MTAKVRISPPAHRAKWAQGSPSFCAVCTSDVGPFVQQPIGRGDALVAVCTKCDGEAPVHRVSDRGYDFHDGMSQHDMNRRMAERLGRARPAAEIINKRRRNETARDKTDGYLLERVWAKDLMGRARDAKEAAASFAEMPWYRELHYLGPSRGYHVFERPDPKLTAAQRTPSGNPLIAIERFRVKGGGR